MSYILDALKKSDQERPRGSVPDLQTVQDVPEPRSRKRRNWWPALLAGALLLNSIILLFWWGPWREEARQAGSRPQTVAGAVRAGEKPAVPARGEKASARAGMPGRGQRRPAAGTVAEKQPRAPEPGGERNIPPRPQPTAPVVTQSVPRTPPAGPEPAQPVQAAARHPGNQETGNGTAGPPTSNAPTAPGPPRRAEQRRAASKPAAPAPAAPRIRQRRTATAAPAGLNRGEPPQPETRAVLAMSQLPASVRKSLPAINISAIFYSKKPTSRLVSINGRVTREGQQIGNGISVTEITRDGVVLSYRNYRFKMKVF